MEIESFLLVSANENRVLGIAPSQTQSTAVVVTIEYQGVYVYDVPTQQCLTSWLLSPGMKLTTHASLHSASGTFLAVLDNKTLLSWNVGVKDFKQISRKTVCVSKPTADLFKFPFGPIHSIHELLQFATCQAKLRRLAENGQESKKKARTAIVWSSLQALHGTAQDQSEQNAKAASDQMLVYITKLGATTQLTVVTINRFLNITHVTTQTLEERDKTLITAAWDMSTLTLATFWSSGELVLYKFGPNSQNNDVWAQPTVIRRMLNSFNNTGVVSTFLHPGQLILAGKTNSNPKTSVESTKTTEPSPKGKRRNSKGGQLAPTKQKVEEESSTNVLMLWDTNLGIVQGQKEIECTPPPAIHNDVPLPLSGSKQTTLLHAEVNLDATKIFLALHGGVIVCPIISCPPPTLKESLGKFSKTHTLLQADDPLKTSTPGVFTLADILKQHKHNKKFPSKQQQQNNDDTAPQAVDKEPVKLANERESVIAQKLLDKSQTPNANAFNKAVRTYIEYEDQHRNASQKDKQLYFSQRTGVELTKRCLQDQMWSSLDILLSHCSLSSQTLPELIPSLMEHSKLSQLMEVVLIFDDIPSHVLVEVMKYFISSCSSTQLRDGIAASGGVALVDQNDPLSLVLNLIIARPVTRQFMLPCLSILDVKELKVLLVYLTESLNHFAYNTMVNVQAKQEKEPNNKFKYPSLKQILLWSSMLIDAHYSRFIIVEELSELIKELNALVEAHLELSLELSRIRGAVQHLLTGGMLPETGTRDYEIIQLSL